VALGGAGGTLGGDSDCVDKQGCLDPARMADSTVGATGVKEELPVAKTVREG
jgi:hypothetical protein